MQLLRAIVAEGTALQSAEPHPTTLYVEDALGLKVGLVHPLVHGSHPTQDKDDAVSTKTL